MTSLRDVVLKKREEARRFESAKQLIRAVIIEVDGSTSPPNLDNFVWFASSGLPESYGVAYNSTGLNYAGAVVWIGQDPRPGNRWQVIEPYTDSHDVFDDTPVTRLAIGVHGLNHQMVAEDNIGPDPVKIYQPSIQMLKTTGDGATLTITTQSLIYTVGGLRREFAGAETDMTGYVPAAGYARRVAVYLDKDTNTLDFVTGDTVAISDGLPPSYPVMPRGSIPSAWIYLEGGQTTITTADEVDDARFLLYEYARILPPFKWTWADGTERAAESVTANDINSLGLQLSNYSIWILDDTLTFIQVGGQGSGLVREGVGTYSIIVADEDLTHSVTGDYSAAAFGESLSVSGNWALALGGLGNFATGLYTVVVGGEGNTASGEFATILNGEAGVASGDKSVVLGGTENQATASHGFVHGNQGLADKYNQYVHGAGIFDVLGDVQASRYIARKEVEHSDASWYELFLDGVAERITVPTNSAWTYTVMIIGTEVDGGNAYSFWGYGAVQNAAGTTSILAGTLLTLYDTGDVSFDARIVADDANDALVVEVQDSDGGGAIVRWVAVIITAEINHHTS